MEQPTMVMMVGLPYSGKSHFIANEKMVRDFSMLSTDEYIQKIAQACELDYNTIFFKAFKCAEMAMNAKLQRCIANKENIVFDQTNLTKTSRAKKLAKVPDYYRKIAVVLPELSDEDLKERMQKRSSHFVPLKTIEDMKKAFEEPDQSEDFDMIYIVGMDDIFIGKE